MHQVRLGLILLISATLWAETLPSGSGLEVRLLRPVGSRISHPGDPIEAVVIAPVTQYGRVLVPFGATLSGRIQSVDRLGLGLKRARATMEFQFDTLHLQEGSDMPIRTRLAYVETAKEKVSESGMVGGIRPAANLSTTASYYVLPILCLDPAFGVPVLAVKFLIARSPDSEIFFPAGTELVLRLMQPLEVVTTGKEVPRTKVQPLSPSDLANAQALLDRLPSKQADHGP